MTFLDFLKVKNYENMFQNARSCTIKFFFSGKHAPEPPSKRVATPRVARSPLKNCWPPCQILHTPINYCTTEKFI